MRLELELETTPPFDGDALVDFLGARAVAGVESVEGTVYRRSARLAHGPAVIELEPHDRGARAAFVLGARDDELEAVLVARRVLDLDADPVAIAAALEVDRVIGPLVAGAPGRRVPGTVDPFEIAVRAVLGQQVSVAAARTAAGRLTARHGEPLAEPVGAVTHLFPSAEAIAAIDPGTLPMPASRARALVGLAAAVAGGSLRLSPGRSPKTVRDELTSLPGIGPWTAAYISMRALGDADAFLPTDLGVRHALTALGHDAGPKAAAALAQRWRPFRAYALQHLWSVLSTPPQPIPATSP